MVKELLWKCFTENEGETDLLIKNRFNNLESPYAVYLEGEVGAGKTYICQKVAELKGVNCLTSSSFLNFNIYYGKNKIIHADYYYNKKPCEFFYNNIFEEIDEDTIFLSEWSPECFELSINQYALNISVVNGSYRLVSFYSI